MEAGAKKIGYKEVQSGRMAINSEPHDGRGSCQQLGFCFQACKSGVKWSTLYTEIPKGGATGNLELRPTAMAIKMEHDGTGKVTAVVHSDEIGALQRHRARTMVVAGISIGSPCLLLNSTSNTVKGGMPVASVHCDDHPNDVAMRAHAVQQGTAICKPVGAIRTIPTPPYPRTHNLGANRMSAEARDRIVNKLGQSDDIKNLAVSDGSQITSGAACDPT